MEANMLEKGGDVSPCLLRGLSNYQLPNSPQCSVLSQPFPESLATLLSLSFQVGPYSPVCPLALEHRVCRSPQHKTKRIPCKCWKLQDQELQALLWCGETEPGRGDMRESSEHPRKSQSGEKE